MEQLRWKEKAETRPSTAEVEKTQRTVAEKSSAVAAALKADPKSEGVFSRVISGAWKGAYEWAGSAIKGMKAVFVGTGEFIGVGAAKLVHEGTDSFMDYAGEKTAGIRKVVNIAGEAIAITAFEAVHGDESVLLKAVEYWKGQGVEFGKLPAEKQAELAASFVTQVTIGIVGSKGLWAVSKTATAAKSVDISATVAGRVADKAVSATAKVGVMAAGLDSSAMGSQIKKPKAVPATKAANDSAFAVAETKMVANGAPVQSGMVGTVESTADRRIHIRPGTPEYDAYRKGAEKHGIKLGDGVAPSKPRAAEVRKENAKVVDATAEIAERAAKTAEATRLLAVDAMTSGEPVFIKRSSGEIAVGRISRIAEDQKVHVTFSTADGTVSSRAMDFKEFKRLNDPDARLAPEIGREQIRMRNRMATSAERSGNGIEASTAEVFANSSIANPTERVRKAGLELGLGREMTEKESAALLKAHGIKGEGESAFNFGTKSLGQKMKILQEEGGFTKDQTKLLLRKGYAGEASVTAERGKEIVDVLKRGNYDEQMKFLSSASLGEIDHSINRWFMDKAADAFDADFINALSRVSATYEKNAANLAATGPKFRSIVDELPKSVPAEQKKLLSGIVDRALAASVPDFKQVFAAAKSPSEITKAIKALPESVGLAEAMPSIRTSLSRMATGNQAEALKALEALSDRFEEGTKEIAVLAIGITDPKLWSSSPLFKKDLWFSANGDEFRELMKSLSKTNPAKVETIASGEFTAASYQLRGLEKAAVLEKPFNRLAFQDKFVQVTDTERLSILLGEHADTKLLGVAEVTNRVGAENLDRFFYFSLDRLNAQAAWNPALGDQIKRVLTHYGRDASGYSKTAG